MRLRYFVTAGLLAAGVLVAARQNRMWHRTHPAVEQLK
jgi:hypothetical protein